MRINLPFAILRPVVAPPRTEQITHLGYVEDLSTLDEIVLGHSGIVMGLDFETRGDVDEENSRVVTLALSDARGTVTMDFRGGNPYAYPYIMGLLYKKNVALVAHNAYFDASWSLRDLVLCQKTGDVFFSPAGAASFGIEYQFCEDAIPLYIPMLCSYAAYRHTANEGWDGQKYGLASAQIELLGWEESNKDAVAHWLSANGMTKTRLAKRITSVPPEQLNESDYADFLRAADKGQLWKVPYDVLAPYNALDADACYLLWTQVLAPRLDEFQELRDWMTKTYPAYTKILIEQKLRGISLDMDYLARYKTALEIKAQSLKEDFRNHPMLKPHIDEMENNVRLAYKAKEPGRHTQATLIGPEPKRVTKTGAITKQWISWRAKMDKQEKEGRPIAPNWLDWDRKMKELSGPLFSMTSDLNMTELFYKRLALEVRVTTESGLASISVDALAHAPDGIGNILQHWSTINKELTSVDSLLGMQRDGIYRPKVRTPGTHTARLSGSGGYNVQNVSKSPVLRAFAARFGYKLLTADIASLEQVVMTELSQDPALWKLYGPEARPGNDVYLFNASQIKALQAPVLDAGYDPVNFTPETVAKAKKGAKRQRDISKVVTLSCLAADTLVLTNRGVVPIIKVTLDDLVWDGIEWVQHRGVVYKGDRTCINFNGVRLTDDHKVLTKNGWKVSSEACAAQLLRPEPASYTWSDFWRLVGNLFRRN